jgi:hypothetical protein
MPFAIASTMIRSSGRTAASALRHGSSRHSVRALHQHHSFVHAQGKNFLLASRLAAGMAVGSASLLVLSKDYLFAPASCDARKNTGDVVMLGPTVEPATGILFPRLCNALTFVGCGVRVKWRFAKVYAVGTYVDPLAFSYVKDRGDEEIQKALLDPKHPRTIRVVMNRAVSIDKYTSAIIEALEPRMAGEDLDKLEEFKMLNPPGDLVEGAVMEMTIRGDTLLYRNSGGSVGAIHSEVFCKALCDVYYGADAVSEPHKEDVIMGIKHL